MQSDQTLCISLCSKPDEVPQNVADADFQDAYFRDSFVLKGNHQKEK